MHRSKILYLENYLACTTLHQPLTDSERETLKLFAHATINESHSSPHYHGKIPYSVVINTKRLDVIDLLFNCFFTNHHLNLETNIVANILNTKMGNLIEWLKNFIVTHSRAFSMTFCNSVFVFEVLMHLSDHRNIEVQSFLEWWKTVASLFHRSSALLLTMFTSEPSKPIFPLIKDMFEQTNAELQKNQKEHEEILELGSDYDSDDSCEHLDTDGEHLSAWLDKTAQLCVTLDRLDINEQILTLKFALNAFDIDWHKSHFLQLMIVTAMQYGNEEMYHHLLHTNDVQFIPSIAHMKVVNNFKGWTFFSKICQPEPLPQHSFHLNFPSPGFFFDLFLLQDEPLVTLILSCIEKTLGLKQLIRFTNDMQSFVKTLSVFSFSKRLTIYRLTTLINPSFFQLNDLYVIFQNNWIEFCETCPLKIDSSYRIKNSKKHDIQYFHSRQQVIHICLNDLITKNYITCNVIPYTSMI